MGIDEPTGRRLGLAGVYAGWGDHCTPPPRVTGSEEATGRPSTESSVDALFAPPSPETIPVI